MKHNYLKRSFTFLLSAIFVFSSVHYVSALEAPEQSIDIDEIVTLADDYHYEMVYGTPVTRTVSGYVDSGGPGGTRFATGGGFYYSESGNPTSVSVSFIAPYGLISVSVNLGKASSSGQFVFVPDTTNYYKLFVSKEVEIKPYVIYQYPYYGAPSGSVYQRGATTTVINTTLSAVKVG